MRTLRIRLLQPQVGAGAVARPRFQNQRRAEARLHWRLTTEQAAALMVTKAQADKLIRRIDALEVAMGGPHEIKYEVYLTFFEPCGNMPGETWEEL